MLPNQFGKETQNIVFQLKDCIMGIDVSFTIWYLQISELIDENEGLDVTTLEVFNSKSPSCKSTTQIRGAYEVGTPNKSDFQWSSFLEY